MTYERSLELKRFVHSRATGILNSGWWKDIDNFTYEQNLTSNELEFVFNCFFKLERAEFKRIKLERTK